MIYIVLCKQPLSIKVGYSKSNASARLTSLQVGCPEKLALIFTMPGEAAR
jgi:hypothetical protein